MQDSKFSEIAWAANQSIYNAIIQHPFNQELLDGTLKKDIFSYYIEQDSKYLEDFAKTLAVIASKLDNAELIIQFIDFAHGAIIAEQEDVHQHYRKSISHNNVSNFSVACLGYTSYLLRNAFSESVEVAIATVIPCFWVYNEVGNHIKQNTQPNNSYQKWIDNYASQDFANGVKKILAIANNYYNHANNSTQEKMLEAFKHSMMWEYRFWDDAYNCNHFI